MRRSRNVIVPEKYQSAWRYESLFRMLMNEHILLKTLNVKIQSETEKDRGKHKYNRVSQAKAQPAGRQLLRQCVATAQEPVSIGGHCLYETISSRFPLINKCSVLGV
jgi:hypothetical protein